MKSFDFLFDLAGYQANRDIQTPAGGHWKQGITQSVSYRDLLHLQKKMAWQLKEQNVQKGGRVALITDHFNLAWLATDMAIMSLGAISVPIQYPLHEAELKTILDRMDPVLILRSESISNPALSSFLSTVSFEGWIRSAQGMKLVDDELLDSIRRTISGSDLATIVHTSGSSGEPRAVCLSHENLMSNVMSLLTLVPFTPGTKVMSFLPLSHIFERMACYVYLASGASIYFLDSYRYAAFALKDIRPDYFTSVPLILERFAAALEDRIEEMSWLTRWAYRSWEKTNRGVLSHLGSLIAHQWIIKRWKRRMGGKLKGIVSGAAYLDPKVERLYERSGIKIRQGYGLTEVGGVIAVNRFEPGGHKRGTVGLPIPCVEVKIAHDGEVLVKGPNVMSGYYNDAKATQQVLVEGWLHTGDIGYFDKDQFLIITDRKSNIYKHASGKFISPASIESTLTQNPLISQAMIIGHHRPYTIALILPDFDLLKKVCAEKKIHWTAPEYMIHNTLVVALYRETLDHLDLLSHERIEKFVLLAEPWTVENGLLTATYKPRRKEITLRYHREIEEMYL